MSRTAIKALARLPPLAILALMSLNVITGSTTLAIGFAAALLAFDLLAWRLGPIRCRAAVRGYRRGQLDVTES